ncbi:MAG: hypothetical protein LBL76_01760 [Treponema sp.]|nr:hypothetical protein [Treponema sp.]
MKNALLMVLTLSILMVFVGCASNIPITKNVIQEVGIDNTPEFQYYVSKTITLRLVAQKRETIIEDGQLIRRSSTERSTIVITGSLPGLTRGYQPRKDGEGNPLDGHEIKIAFENYEGNPVIWFGQYRTGSEEKYYILYNDDSNRIIKYGNEFYSVHYRGDEPPYLRIKMKQSARKKEQSRRASGLRLGQ